MQYSFSVFNRVGMDRGIQEAFKESLFLFNPFPLSIQCFP